MPSEGAPDANLSWMVENLLDRAAEAEKAAAARDDAVLAARGRELAAPLADLGAAAGDAYVTFAAGTEKFALAAAAVEEVLPLPWVTPVPGAPAPAMGLFSRRGEIYVALDGNKVLGTEPADGASYALILRGGVVKAALLVDDVTAVATLDAAAVRPAEFGGHVVRGLTVSGERVLDARVLMTAVARALGVGGETG